MKNECRSCGQSLDMEVEHYCNTCEQVLCQGCAEEHGSEGHRVEKLK